MCGIFGIVDISNGGSLDADRFGAALETIAHRGPDGYGVRYVNDAVLLGHRRLAIIDLSDDSAQPMVREGRYWLTYNGEIFNYVELREELRAMGEEFTTTGDTEVVLAAYCRWGSDCVRRFNGMWSFAVYDTETGTLFCSRDRFGEKPLCYAEFGGKFFFASEIKAILAYEPRLAEPAYNVIANYCRSSVGAQHAETWFRCIQRVPPGCNLTLKDGVVSIERYWTYPEKVDRAIGFDEAQKRYAALFRDAVRIRMRSDVPLGLTLSSGLDSSSIAYAMQAEDPTPHYCFTAGFPADLQPGRAGALYVDTEGGADESPTARRIANDIGLTSIVVETDYSRFVADLSRIVHHLESGNSSPAVFPLMQLLGEARKRLTVLLEGQGADELLAGYVGTLIWKNAADLARAGRWRESFAAVRQFAQTYRLGYAVLLMLRGASNRIPAISRLNQRLRKIEPVFGPRLRRYRHMADYPAIGDDGASVGVSRELRRQHSGGLVNLLHYGDAISMANSLESRMPFLDYRLVEFVWSLPTEFKIKLGVGKYIHREAMRGLVPDWIIDNRIKHGFTTPVSELFARADDGPDSAAGILLSHRCLERGIFDRDGLSALISDHRAGKRDHGPLLFRLLSTELWFRTFIDRRGEQPASTSTPVAEAA